MIYRQAEETYIPVSAEFAGRLGEYAFALKMTDDSMIPEMRINDIQIIDPSASPNPSDYVAVKIIGRKCLNFYKQLSFYYLPTALAHHHNPKI